jgi:uncharacterized membrane protein SpoIIM required for sporulation
MGAREDTMIRTLALASVGFVAWSAGVFAYSGTDREQAACRHDVIRHCRTVASQNEFAILACLQQNRPKLSVACRTVLQNHGQ